MIDNLVENLWERLQSAFEPLVVLILALDSHISHSMRKSSNDAFPLRAYVAFMVGEEEIAVTIDLQNSDGQLTIGADICCDDGKILAEGPTAILGNLNEPKIVEKKLNEWVGSFEVFLSDTGEVLTAELLKCPVRVSNGKKS